MPELNHKFTLGRMNKDLDERLVPNGEYRDALNAQVTTSEGSDVGTLQNLLGNVDISSSFINFDGAGDPIGDYEYHCIGSIVDGKTDRIYWLLAGTGKDVIAEYDYNTEIVSPIVVDIFNSNTVAGAGSGRVLNFDKNFLITGINIIDDFLFWTDNNTEPKQLSIKRSKLGCIDPATNTPSFSYKSDLYVKTRKRLNQLPPFVNVGKLKEEHITVIKKSPKTAPRLEMKNTTRVDVDGDGVFGNITSTLTVDEPTATLIDSDNNWVSGAVDFATDTLADFSAGDFLVLTLNQTASPLQEVSEIIIEIQGAVRYHAGVSSIPANITTMPTSPVTGVSTGVWFRANIVSGNLEINSTINNFTVKLKQSQSLFKFKFPRFAYRYKYTDGQYSTFSPFSEVAFLPSEFDYLPKEGYNLGMVNSVRKLAVKDFVDRKLIQDDVVEIDILYKESNSPVVYTVDTIKRVDVEGGKWDAWNGVDINNTSALNTTGFLNITSEVIHAVVPANQMLRGWDNIPRKALAQEIVGNRIVYGNYLQNYDMYNNNNVYATGLSYYGQAAAVLRKNSNITVDVKLRHASNPISTTTGMVPELQNPFNANFYSPAKSIKSLRTYQIGVSYIDEFGRETPVFSSALDGKNSLQVDKATAHEAGKLKAQVFSHAPQWAKNFKFLIKESSNEYYNLAMDRWYPAQDGNIWLSFPSAERNKLDDETFLILKKRHDSSINVSNNTKYKVLAIENEAPLFIKTKRKNKKTVFDLVIGNPTGGMLNVIGTAAAGFNSSATGFPTPGGTNIIFDEASVFTLSAMIEKEGISNWEFRVRHAIGGTSKWYGIQSYEEDALTGDRAKLVSKKIFGTDMGVTSPVSWDNLAAATLAAFGDIQVEFAKREVEELPEFDGRFFVKVLSDSTIKAAIIGATVTGATNWTVTNAAIAQYINAEPQYAARPVNDWEDNNGGGSKFFGEDPDYISISEHALGGTNNDVKYHDIHNVTEANGGGQSYWKMAANTTYVDSSSSGWFIDKIEAFRPWKSTGAMGWNFAGTNDDNYNLNYETAKSIYMCNAAGTDAKGYQKQLKLIGTGTHSTINSGQNYLNLQANSGHDAVPQSTSGVSWLQSRNTYKYGGITPSKGIDKTDSIIHLSYAGTGKDHSPTGSQGLDSLSQLKTHFDDSAWSGSYVDEIAFISQITTKGSLWRWAEDPDGIIYRTTGWDPGMTMSQSEWDKNYIDNTDAFLGVSLYNYSQFSDYLVWHKTKYRAWNFWNGWYTAGNVHHTHFVSSGQGNVTWTMNPGGFAAYLAGETFVSRQAVANMQLANPLRRTCHGEGFAAPLPHHKWPQFTLDYSKAKNKRRRYMFAAKPFTDADGAIVDDALSGNISTLGAVWNNDGTQTANYLPTNDPDLPSHFDAASSRVLSTTTTPPRPIAIDLGGTNAPGIRPDGVYSGYTTPNGGIVPSLKTVDAALVQSMSPGSCTFQVIEPYIESDDDGGFTTTNPAIWETEPKEDLGLDLYYEVGQIYPVELNGTNMEQFTGPVRNDKNLNTKVTCWQPPFGGTPSTVVTLTTGITYDLAQATALGDLTLVGSIIPGSDDIRVVSHEIPEINFRCFDPSGLETGAGTYENCEFVMLVVAGPTPATTTLVNTGVATGNTWESTAFGSDKSVWLEDINGVPLVGDPATMFSWPNQVAPPPRSILIFTREDGSTTESAVADQAEEIGWTQVTSTTGVLVDVAPVLRNSYELEADVHNYEVSLPWYNCYSFGNGVESNRIRDDYNQVFIDKGAKVSTVLEEPYLEDRRLSGLIYSGIYNSMSNVNNLNQFIQAEKITKDLNPDGGSIQKLYTRDTNLVTICEDKVFKILANKDALFNADGNPQLVATNRVLGEATTFAGDYGISTNPESFAVDSFRMYFTDRVRGSVIRLSQDGITPISSIGMTDWFNDNLVSAKRLVGSFDDKKEEYNLNLGYFDYTTYSVDILVDTRGSSVPAIGVAGGPPAPPAPIVYSPKAPGVLAIKGADASNFAVGDIVSGQGLLPNSVITAIEYQGGGEWHIKLNQTPDINDLWALLPDGKTSPYNYGPMDASGAGTFSFPTRITASVETQPSRTISFSEKNKGWVSFKSFLKEGGLSLNNEYFTFKHGVLNQHHTNPVHNNFYGQQFDSSVEVLFNDIPGSVKSFGTLDYEGSQSHITQDLQNSGEYWDNKNKLGWYVSNIYTDLQEGDLHEFKDKEGKWFSQLKGVTTKWLDDGKGGNIDTNEFSYQGIDDNSGVAIVSGGYTSWDCDDGGLAYNVVINGVFTEVPVTDATSNIGVITYNPAATTWGATNGSTQIFDWFFLSANQGLTLGNYAFEITGNAGVNLPPLHPNDYVVVTFSNTNLKTVTDLIDARVNAGYTNFYHGMTYSDFKGVSSGYGLPIVNSSNAPFQLSIYLSGVYLTSGCTEIPGLTGSYATEQLCLADPNTACGALCAETGFATSITAEDATNLDCDNGYAYVNLPTMDPSVSFWNVSYKDDISGTVFDDLVTYYFFGDSNSYTLPEGEYTATVVDSNGCTSQQSFEIICDYNPQGVCGNNFTLTMNIVDAASPSTCPTSLANGSVEIANTSISAGAFTWSVEYFSLVNGILTSIFLDNNSGNGYYTNDLSNLGQLTTGDYVARISDDGGCSEDYPFEIVCVAAPVVTCMLNADAYDKHIVLATDPVMPGCNNGALEMQLTAVNGNYTNGGQPLPTTITVEFEGTDMISGASTGVISTATYQVSNFPINFFETGLSDGIQYVWTWTDNNGCSDILGMNLNNCVSTPHTWDCDGIGNCSDPGTGLGAYNSLVACNNACSPQTWYCSNGSCYSSNLVVGPYLSLAACQANCTIPPAAPCTGSLQYLDNGTTATHSSGTSYQAGMSNPNGHENYLQANNPHHQVIINFNASNQDGTADCNDPFDPYFRTIASGNYANGGAISVEIPEGGLNNGPLGSKNVPGATAATTCRVWLEPGTSTSNYYQGITPMDGCHYQTFPGVNNNSCNPYVNFYREGLVKTPLPPYNVPSMQNMWYGDVNNSFNFPVIGKGYQNSDCDFFGLLIKWSAPPGSSNSTSPAVHGDWKIYLEDDKGRIYCWSIVVPCDLDAPILM